MYTLSEFDELIRRDHNIQYLCGVDEAGRGPLFGPVIAGAVVLPESFDLPGLNDSKKLTAKRRETLYEEICRQAISYAVGRAEAWEIDQYNILNASLLAMRRAVDALKIQPEWILIDGNQSRGLEQLPVQTVIKGDGKSACIAAASVLAKVTRDREMCLWDERYPGYGLAKHKGYPTKEHYQALNELGPAPEHRRSFLKKWKRCL